MNTEPSEYWASLDQFTSFAKDPWGFNRPENRKEHNVLSKATFVEWPNTTSNFSLHRGVAPAGKLAASRTSRLVNLPLGSERVSSSSAVPKTTNNKNPSCAISDAQLRAAVSTNNGFRSADRSGAIRTPTPGKKTTPRASSNTTTARHSADNVTAAYTLLQQTGAQRSMVYRKANENTRRVTTPIAAPPAHQGTMAALPQQPKQTEQQQEDRLRKSSSPSYDWSVKNIGFNDIKSEARKRMERENREGYERASFASCDADKPYIAEAAHFRFRYPHTLGRIQALSKARSDRVGVRRDRIGASDDRKRSKK